MVSPLSVYRRLPSLGRDRRRLAVVAAFAGYPLLQVGYATLVAPGRLSSTLWAPIALGLLALTLGGVFVIYAYGRDRMSDRAVDERQRAMHDRALLLSYRVVTIAVGLTIGAAAGLAMNQPIVIDFPTLIPFIVVFALYMPFLPFAALAWIEADPPGNDELRAE